MWTRIVYFQGYKSYAPIVLGSKIPDVNVFLSTDMKAIIYNIFLRGLIMVFQREILTLNFNISMYELNNIFTSELYYTLFSAITVKRDHHFDDPCWTSYFYANHLYNSVRFCVARFMVVPKHFHIHICLIL